MAEIMDNIHTKSFCPEGFPVAMAYVPWQKGFETYDLNKAFKIGTIFPCLNKPFEECFSLRGGMR